MSKVTVPIGMQEDLDLEAAVAYLRKIRCERVFLAQIYRALERDADYFAVLSGSPAHGVFPQCGL